MTRKDSMILTFDVPPPPGRNFVISTEYIVQFRGNGSYKPKPETIRLRGSPPSPDFPSLPWTSHFLQL